MRGKLGQVGKKVMSRTRDAQLMPQGRGMGMLMGRNFCCWRCGKLRKIFFRLRQRSCFWR